MTEVVTLAALIYLSRGPHLVLTEGAQELLEDEVLQPLHSWLLLLNIRLLGAPAPTLSTLSPLLVFQFTQLLLTQVT